MGERGKGMIERFEYYDILSIMIPGTLLLAWIQICFPAVSALVCPLAFPEAFGVLVLIALAVFLGNLIQAISSNIEPLIYWTWGGRPSDQVLAGGLAGYLPKDSAARIKTVLREAMGGNPSDHSVFLFAMQRAHAAEVGRVSQFNSLYAYHRGLLTLLALAAGLLIAAMVWGQAISWTWAQKAGLLILIALLFVLVWHRTKQRAFYYVREVLLTAERILDEQHVEKE